MKIMPSGLLPLVFICFPHPSLQNAFPTREYRMQFFGGKQSRCVCVTIYSRRARIIFEISSQNPKISTFLKNRLMNFQKTGFKISVL